MKIEPIYICTKCNRVFSLIVISDGYDKSKVVPEYYASWFPKYGHEKVICPACDPGAWKGRKYAKK